MVLTAPNLFVALLVASCTTVAATTTARAAATTAASANAAATKETLLPSNASNEAQKEANRNRTDGRTENARSLDIDINKYTSVDFHNKVYDVQTSPENEKFFAHEVSKVHTTYRTSFTSLNINEDNNELTTPSVALFDAKHKQLQNEIKKGLQLDENVQPIEQLEKPADGVAKENKTTLEFVRYTNVLADEDARNRTAVHRNYETAKGLQVSYESVYNQSDPVVDTTFKVHSAKSPLLNNKIENDKAINISKRGFSTQPQSGNSTHRPVTGLPQDRSNLIPSVETVTDHGQISQENNIYSVLVPAPLTTAPAISTEIAHTKMYEMTENEFATTSESAFEVHDGSEEKFYEMTTTATTTPAADFETTIGTTVATTVSQSRRSGIHESLLETLVTTTLSPATTENDISTITNEEDANATASGTTENILTTAEHDTSTTELAPEVTTLQHREDSEIGSTVVSKTTTETDNLTTTTMRTDDATTTELEFATSTEARIEATTLLPVVLGNASSQLEEQTATEPTEVSATTILSAIATTIKQFVSATYEGNVIVKEANETEGSIVHAPSNEIRKENATTDHDLDDLTEEVPDDDYIDVQRKAKPVVSSEANQSNNETVTEVVDHPKPVTTMATEVTTIEDDAVGVTEDASRTSDPEGSSGTIIAIVLSTVGAICLVLLAVLLFVMRRRQKRFNYGQRCTPVSLDAYSMDNVSVYNSVRRKAALRGSKRSYGNPAFDDDASVSHPLNFQAIVRFANNADDIKAEFEEIPQVNAKRNELPDGCDTKNRYANVIPLPESRVFLSHSEDDPTSDYINANYVTGPKGVRGYYIACQAPLHNTVNDFWRMIWEQQSKVILMLTHLFENGVEKCVDYLPPSEIVDCHRLFGDYQITLKKREVKDKYIIASLQLKNMVSNSWREVTHLWYSGWPEKGVPEEENSIIAFLIEARSYIKLVQSVEPKENGVASITSNSRGASADSSPVIVHCSPGTGRTGTVIACDIAIREFELRRIVDIPRIVYRIRRDRASSVQTKDQYHFIYKVINLYATKLTGGALDSI